MRFSANCENKIIINSLLFQGEFDIEDSFTAQSVWAEGSHPPLNFWDYGITFIL